MTKIFFKIALCGILFASCAHRQHGDAGEHNHDDARLQLTAYGEQWEVYVEADPFAVGYESGVTAHFSSLENFKPMENGRVTATLTAGGKSVSRTLERPARPGVYSFDIKPEAEGAGQLVFSIDGDSGKGELAMPGIEVFAGRHEAGEAAAKTVIANSDAVPFAKEQSWKVDFATALPACGDFGQVIKTAARVQSAPNDGTVIVAKASGTVLFTGDDIASGKAVAAGQKLFTVAGGGFADNDMGVRFAGAANDFDKAKADYERAVELSETKIVAEKDLRQAKLYYDNAKAAYDNMRRDFSAAGQRVVSPISGFIRQLHVSAGQFVEAGHPLATVSRNKSLFLTADLPPKYIPALGNVLTANIHATDGKTYSLEELNGRLLSCGKSAEGDNFLIPVTFQVENRENFVPGGFVDLYIKTRSDATAISVPNEALTEEMGNYFVYVQLTPELFEKREVAIGPTDGRRTEITAGLSTQERIVTKGAVLVKLVAASGTGTMEAHAH